MLGIGLPASRPPYGRINVYRGNRKFIHINIEPSEIGKIFEPDLGIVADAGKAIHALLTEASRAKKSEWDIERSRAAEATRP